MLIRCKYERPGGSLVTFSYPGKPDYREYNFQPTATSSKHVADVADEGDARTLLAIDSAYEPYDDASRALLAQVVADASAPAVAEEEKNADPLAFLDELDMKGLESFAKQANVKLDPTHDEVQVRNYLKGLAQKQAG